eukprot:TRINITY_DN1148_c0_g3_i1.p1 TRINITY_DN1148_c0_g3~~TRINITY_DN1148_c0_g3_i1.p1  ORF type:complete len:323 (+),score=-34.53 TRINITY_DN1148_c0_g3_i1:455-1423(+)
MGILFSADVVAVGALSVIAGDEESVHEHRACGAVLVQHSVPRQVKLLCVLYGQDPSLARGLPHATCDGAGAQRQTVHGDPIRSGVWSRTSRRAILRRQVGLFTTTKYKVYVNVVSRFREVSFTFPRSEQLANPPRHFAWIWIDVAVGFAFTADLKDCDVLNVLYASGKCHDYDCAVVAASVLSVDKWLTASILLWARWLSWISILLGTVMIPSKGTGLPRSVMEIFMVGTALLDSLNSLNLRKEQREANERLESEIFGKSAWYSIRFFLVLATACVLYALYVPAWFRDFEFPASLLLSAVCCKYVDSLICRRLESNQITIIS